MSYKDKVKILFDYSIDKNIDDFMWLIPNPEDNKLSYEAEAIKYLIERLRIADQYIEEIENTKILNKKILLDIESLKDDIEEVLDRY